MVYAEKDDVSIAPTDNIWPASGIGRVLLVLLETSRRIELRLGEIEGSYRVTLSPG